MIYSCLLGDKSDALRLDEKKYGGTKQQMNALLKFEILAMWYFKRVTVNSSLRFPMKNLMLKVSNKEWELFSWIWLARIKIGVWVNSAGLNNLGRP